MALRPLNHAEQADFDAACKFLTSVEAVLCQLVPEEVALIYVKDLRDLIRSDPDFARLLGNCHRLPVSQRHEKVSEYAAWLNESLAPNPQKYLPATTTNRVRTGARLLAKGQRLVRIAKTPLAANALAILANGEFRLAENENAVTSTHDTTEVHVECNGFGVERAIHELAKRGPSILQTFVALTGLWMEKMKGQSRERNLEAEASDVLNFMGRKNPHGGHHNADIMQRGHDIAILMNTSVKEKHIKSVNGVPKRVDISIVRPLVIEAIAAQLPLDDAELKSVVKFRYHLGKELYEWLREESLDYVEISGKILKYHADRQKYQILLGTCLAIYDRNYRKGRAGVHRISLPSLLTFANIDVPNRNVYKFVRSIESAISELSTDGVIPGVRLELPSKREDKTWRDCLLGATVEFPFLPSGKLDQLMVKADQKENIPLVQGAQNR